MTGARSGGKSRPSGDRPRAGLPSIRWHRDEALDPVRAGCVPFDHPQAALVHLVLEAAALQVARGGELGIQRDPAEPGRIATPRSPVARARWRRRGRPRGRVAPPRAIPADAAPVAFHAGRGRSPPDRSSLREGRYWRRSRGSSESGRCDPRRWARASWLRPRSIPVIRSVGAAFRIARSLLPVPQQSEATATLYASHDSPPRCGTIPQRGLGRSRPTGPSRRAFARPTPTRAHRQGTYLEHPQLRRLRSRAVTALRVGTPQQFQWLGGIVKAVLILNLLDAVFTPAYGSERVSRARPTALMRELVNEHASSSS